MMERRTQSNDGLHSNSSSTSPFRRLTFRGKRLEKPRDIGSKGVSQSLATVSIPESRSDRVATGISITPGSIESLPFRESQITRLQKRIEKFRSSLRQNVDDAFDTYARQANESSELCRNVLQCSSISPTGSRNEVSLFSSSEPYVVDFNLEIVHDYIECQETLQEHLRLALSNTYQHHEPNTSSVQIEALFRDRAFRNTALQQIRYTSSSLSEAPISWDDCRSRFSNYDRLQTDIIEIKRLCKPQSSIAKSASEDITIAENGDTILEFNSNGPAYPIYRFRVSSHLLCEVSPLFAHMLSNATTPGNYKPDFLSPSDFPSHNPHLPPPPKLQVLKDGSPVKHYRMPQKELNKHGSLTTLLQAAHFQNEKLRREITFQEFVSIAEVCLRYQCTSPIEEKVELRWLPHWYHKAADEMPDGMLLICYVFGLSELFTRVSKSAILNIKDENDICGLWPMEVRNKIKAIRRAKLQQIQNCCRMAISDYLSKPTPDSIRHSIAHSLQFTSGPKCPKKNFSCDAINIGWLILVFNELGIISSIMNTENSAELPKGSLKEITAKLQSVGSPPLKEGHGGVCDFAPSFRSAIDDIYNSITGLTLKDVSGRESWSLSRSSTIPPADEFFSQANDPTPRCGSDGDLYQSLRRELRSIPSPTSQSDPFGAAGTQSPTPVSDDIEETPQISRLSPSPSLQSPTPTHRISEAEMEHLLLSQSSTPSTPSNLPRDYPLAGHIPRFISSDSKNEVEGSENGNQKYFFESSSKEIVYFDNKFLREEADRRIGIGFQGL